MFKLLISTCLFSLSIASFDTQSSEHFEQYKSQAEAKGRKDRHALLEQAYTLLADPNLTAEQRTYVLHRSALHFVRTNQFSKAAARLEEFSAHLAQFPNTVFLGKYHWVAGDLAVLVGNSKDAKYHFEQAISQFSQTKDVRMQSHTHRMLANVLSEQRDYFQALSHVFQAKDKANRINNVHLFSAALSTEARIYRDFNQFDKALDVLNQQLEFQTGQPNVSLTHISSTYYSLARIYEKLFDHPAAIDALNKAYDIDTKLDDKNYMGVAKLHIAEQYIALKDLAAARKAINEASTLFEQVENAKNIAKTNAIKGQIALADNNYTKAIKLITQSLAQLNEQDNVSVFKRYQVYLGQALAHVRPKEAIELLLKLHDTTNNEVNLQILQSLAVAHKYLGEFEQALSYQERAFTMKTQIDKIAISTRLEAKKLNSEIGLKRLEVNELQAGLAKQQEDTKTRTVVLAAAIIVLINFILLFYLYHLKRRRVMEKEAELLSQSLSLKQQLLADVSHELRTPLTVLKLNIEALEYNLTEDPKTTYQVLQRRLDMLNTLIADIYELAQADTNNLRLEFETCQARSLFDDLAVAIAPILDNSDINVVYVNQLPDSLHIDCDTSRLNQVFNNLARNSVHYTDQPGEIKISVFQQQQTVVCHFEDSAPGVSTEALGKLFDRLYRCDKSRSRDLGGSGLGLSICEKIIELHQGSIEAKHSELGGIIIQFTLPIKA
ncbi:ATP-binding protein [Pseudoalteromonas obscura]|uniref:histidine kinase n=1 Tax=Pseudoalteromonas obscura TaxID=3048491 RepID=A0ABT7ENY8_9GAMM|nr:ATP-binding protein [Pseudoalteromonas sp. P94(2023)]MDK2596767.1 ATP-binding protein [Pseudoalteromonas sp. P94(2023)]